MGKLLQIAMFDRLDIHSRVPPLLGRLASALLARADGKFIANRGIRQVSRVARVLSFKIRRKYTTIHQFRDNLRVDL